MYADSHRDESLIVELLEFEHNVADDQSALWFLQDLADEQDAGQPLVKNLVAHLSRLLVLCFTCLFNATFGSTINQLVDCTYLLSPYCTLSPFSHLYNCTLGHQGWCGNLNK